MLASSVIPLIVVLNFSHVPNQTVQHWVVEIQRQVHEDLAPVWHLDATVSFLGTGPAPSGAWQVRIIEPRHAVGNAGFHDGSGHRIPYADVYVLKDDQTDNTLSHEVLEMLANPYNDLYVEDYPWMWEREIADPVQFESYIRNGVHLSNFVFPSWFDALTQIPPYDFMGTCDTPGHPVHGRAIRMNETTGVREVVH